MYLDVCPIDRAINILNANREVLYGIFGQVAGSGYFPPHEFLNDFLLCGSDPCDQDARMGTWGRFALNEHEFDEVKKWWCSLYPETIESDLGEVDWSDWCVKLIHG